MNTSSITDNPQFLQYLSNFDACYGGLMCAAMCHWTDEQKSGNVSFIILLLDDMHRIGI